MLQDSEEIEEMLKVIPKQGAKPPQGDSQGWSHEQWRAWNRRLASPNEFFYRHILPNQERGEGPFTAAEHKRMLHILNTTSPIPSWGYIAFKMGTRVGYQCQQYFTKLVQAKIIDKKKYPTRRELGKTAGTSPVKTPENNATKKAVKSPSVAGARTPLKDVTNLPRQQHAKSKRRQSEAVDYIPKSRISIMPEYVDESRVFSSSPIKHSDETQKCDYQGMIQWTSPLHSDIHMSSEDGHHREFFSSPVRRKPMEVDLMLSSEDIPMTSFNLDSDQLTIEEIAMETTSTKTAPSLAIVNSDETLILTRNDSVNENVHNEQRITESVATKLGSAEILGPSNEIPKFPVSMINVFETNELPESWEHSLSNIYELLPKTDSVLLSQFKQTMNAIVRAWRALKNQHELVEYRGKINNETSDTKMRQCIRDIVIPLNRILENFENMQQQLTSCKMQVSIKETMKPHIENIYQELISSTR